MISLSNKLSILLQGSIYLFSLINVGNFLATPANAQQATASGAVTLIRPSGSYINVSGELILPSGSYYNGGLTITPTFGGITGGNNETITSLTITPEVVVNTTLANPNPFIDAAANLLKNSTSIEDTTAIIQAGGSEKGLGALD